MLQSLGLRGRFAKRNFKTYSSKSSISNPSWEEVEEEAEATDHDPGPRTRRLWDEEEVFGIAVPKLFFAQLFFYFFLHNFFFYFLHNFFFYFFLHNFFFYFLHNFFLFFLTFF